MSDKIIKLPYAEYVSMEEKIKDLKKDIEEIKKDLPNLVVFKTFSSSQWYGVRIADLSPGKHNLSTRDEALGEAKKINEELIEKNKVLQEDLDSVNETLRKVNRALESYQNQSWLGRLFS